MTRPGLMPLRASYPRPHFSSVPGLKFSTTTSASKMRRRARSCPSSSRRLMVTDFLLRAIMGHQRVCPSLRWRPHWRIGSPFPGGSTFMTSAPKSPRSWPQKGPAMRLPISTTRTPSRGGCAPFPATLISFSGLFDLRENGPAGNQGTLIVGQRGDPASVGSRYGLLHLHRLEDQQQLSLFDLVALGYQHPHHLHGHRGRKAGAGCVRPSRSRAVHVGRRWFGEPVALAAEGDQDCAIVEREVGRDDFTVHDGVYLSVVRGDRLDDGFPVVEPEPEFADARTLDLDLVLPLACAIVESHRPEVAPGSGGERLGGCDQRELSEGREQHRLARDRRLRRSLGDAVHFEEAHGGLPGGEGAVIEDAVEERQIGGDTEDHVVPQRPAE